MIMQEKAIHKEMVFLKQALSTKDDVIELLSDQAIKLDLINSKKDFKEAVYKREEMASLQLVTKLQFLMELVILLIVLLLDLFK